MARKTYIYHMVIGHDDKPEVDCFMASANAGEAVDFCKEKYRDKKYNSYQATKVGVSLYPRETQILSAADEMKLRKAGMDKETKYSEREIELPRFVAKDMEDLSL